MPSPFYNAIKGTTAGTPGTGAYTPSGTAAAGYRAWTTVPTGWIGLVRYEDGSAWELCWSYWNGTTLSRAGSQLEASSTGSALTLTSSATASLVVDASEIMSHLGSTPWRGWVPFVGGATPTGIGTQHSAVGTAAGAALAATNFLTEQPRTQYTSATTANAECGANSNTTIALINTSAGRGGCELTTRFGASQLPTNPRLLAGLCGSGFGGLGANEPSASGLWAFRSVAALAKDSSDTNIQFIAKDGASAGAATKIDTGVPLVANGWYEAVIWFEPGSGNPRTLFIRLDTGAIWRGNHSVSITNASDLFTAHVRAALNGTDVGTAAIFHVGATIVRGGC